MCAHTQNRDTLSIISTVVLVFCFTATGLRFRSTHSRHVTCHLDTCIEDVWTAIDLDLNKMCLDGVWVGNAFAGNPMCDGSSGGKAQSISQQLTEADGSVSVTYCEAYTRNWNGWKVTEPATHSMCDGCWFGTSGCVGSTTAYALAPTNGASRGRTGNAGSKIDVEEARISATYCAEQMKSFSECSKEFIGLADTNGHCWCAKAGTDCVSNAGNLNLLHFFQSKLETHSFAHLLIHSRTHLHVDSIAVRDGYRSKWFTN